MYLDFMNQLTAYMQQSAQYLKPWLIVLAIIWGFNIVNWLSGSWLNMLGILPRRTVGLIGIPFAPFLHQGFNHLFFNSIPLFVLGLAIMTEHGVVDFIWISAVIIVIGGLGVWLFARKGLHIGASGVISGYFGYILMEAYKSPSIVSVMLAVLAIYYFGGIFIGLFPQEKTTSWESHLFGFLGGIACAYLPALMVYLKALFPVYG